MITDQVSDICSTNMIGDRSILPSVTISTSNATNASLTWNPNSWSAQDYFINTDSNKSGKLVLQGTNADIEINGQSLNQTLQTIQQRLDILVTDPRLETEWQELRELGDQYRALEQQIRDKMATWQRLTARDRDNL